MERAVYVALITPLNEDESIDVGGLHKLIEWVLDNGIGGIFVGGTVGEGPALRDSEKYVLYRETVQAVRGRVPVLGSVSDCGTARSLDLLDMAISAGVDEVVVTPRQVLPPRTTGETIEHVRTLAEASALPIWFYENPSVTPVVNIFETIAKILALPNVHGLKFSSPDRQLFTRCVNEFQPLHPVLTGNVADIAYAAEVGAAGAISGIASLVPHICVKIFQAASAGNMVEAQRFSRSVQDVYDIYGGEGWPLWPSAQKHVLKRMGLISTSVATSPFCRLTGDDEAMIDQVIDQFAQDVLCIPV